MDLMSGICMYLEINNSFWSKYMKRRLIAFVFSFLMLASLCACGSKEETFSFEELKGNRFVFASGAGAWSTELTIGADGSF